MTVAYFILLPAFDVVTDINYIFTSPFTSVSLFVAACVFLVIPSFDLILIMTRRNVPFAKFHISSKLQSRGENDWLKRFLYLPALILDLISSFLLFLIGLFLHSTKLLTLGCCHNWWYYFWTGSESFSITTAMNVETYNEAMIVNVLLESVPQLAISFYNQASASKVYNMSDAFILSISVSGTIIFLQIVKSLTSSETNNRTLTLPFNIASITMRADAGIDFNVVDKPLFDNLDSDVKEKSDLTRIG
jgi:hypothetical protein